MPHPPPPTGSSAAPDHPPSPGLSTPSTARQSLSDAASRRVDPAADRPQGPQLPQDAEHVAARRVPLRQRDAEPYDSAARDAVVTPEEATRVGRRSEAATTIEDGAESSASSYRRMQEAALSCGVALRPPRTRTYPHSRSLCPATTPTTATRSRDDQEQTRDY